MFDTTSCDINLTLVVKTRLVSYRWILLLKKRQRIRCSKYGIPFEYLLATLARDQSLGDTLPLFSLYSLSTDEICRTSSLLESLIVDVRYQYCCGYTCAKSTVLGVEFYIDACKIVSFSSDKTADTYS